MRLGRAPSGNPPRVCALLLALLLALPGCAPAQPLERTFFAMDTVMTLRLYEGGDENTLDQAEARVRELEGLWSVTDGTSEISTLNHDGSAELSPETAELLGAALDMCRRTDGALDISTYPVLRAWGFTTGEYSVPGGEAIAALLPLVDYGRVALEAGAAALPPGMEIDLGSVAKGYTGDALAALEAGRRSLRPAGPGGEHPGGREQAGRLPLAGGHPGPGGGREHRRGGGGRPGGGHLRRVRAVL